MVVMRVPGSGRVDGANRETAGGRRARRAEIHGSEVGRLHGTGDLVLEVPTRWSAAGTTIAIDTVSAEGTVRLRLERIGAHRCRRRKIASGDIGRVPAREGIQGPRVAARVFVLVTDRRNPDDFLVTTNVPWFENGREWENRRSKLRGGCTRGHAVGLAMVGEIGSRFGLSFFASPCPPNKFTLVNRT